MKEAATVPSPCPGPGVYMCVYVCVCVCVCAPGWPLTPAPLFPACLLGRLNVYFLQLGMGVPAFPCGLKLFCLPCPNVGWSPGPWCWEAQGERREGGGSSSSVMLGLPSLPPPSPAAPAQPQQLHCLNLQQDSLSSPQ